MRQLRPHRHSVACKGRAATEEGSEGRGWGWEEVGGVVERAQEATQSYQQSHGTREIRTEGQGLLDRRTLRNDSSAQLDPLEDPKP